MEKNKKKLEIINRYFNILVIIFIPIYLSCITIRPLFISAELLFIISFGLRFIYKKEELNFLFYWSCIFFIITLFSLIFSPIEYDKLHSITPVIQVLLIMNLLVPYMLESEENRNRIIYSFFLVGLVILIRNFYNLGFHFSSFVKIGSAIGYNINSIAGIFSFITLLALYLSLKKHNKLFFIIAIFFYFLTILSGSRTSFGSLTIVIIYFYISFYISDCEDPIIRKRRIIQSIIFMIFIIVIGIIAIFKIGILYDILGKGIITFINSILGNVNHNTSTTTRLEMFNRGLSLFKDRPLIGWGINSAKHLNRFNTYLHNNYIEILANTGILGFISYYSLYAYCLKKKNNIKKYKANIDLIFCRCLFFTFIISDLGRVSYYSEYTTIIIAFAFSLYTVSSSKTQVLDKKMKQSNEIS